MTQPDDLIVGKSVEEIEAENGNRMNSSVPGEDHRSDTDTLLIPAAGGQMGVGQTAAGTVGVLPGIIGIERQNDDAQAADTRRTTDRDSSEE